MSNHRTITLSNRPPVKIVEDDWPVLAVGSYEHFDGQIRAQATRTKELTVRVRQHADGRAIVYGVYEYSTAHQGERDVTWRVGYLLTPTGDIMQAIRRVGSELSERDVDEDIVRTAVQGCIADLPAEEI